MFTPDRPIESEKDDILGRASFARALGDAIITYKHTDSLVIGLYGAWGSGKTSIINMALEHIDAAYRKDKMKGPIIVQFNPWNFSDQNQLLAQFFKQLSTDLRGPDRTKYIEKAGWVLDRYAELVAPPLAVISGPMGPVVLASGGVAKGVGVTIRHRSELKLKDLHSARASLDEGLRNQQHRNSTNISVGQIFSRFSQYYLCACI